MAAGIDAGAVEATTDDVVTDARKVLDTAATDHDGGVFLEVVSFAADVSGDFIAVAEADTGVFPESRVRFLRGHGADTGADTTLLRGSLVARALRQGVPTMA